MQLPEYDDLDATALADLVRRGEVSADELLDAAVARVEARNPRLNAVIHHHVDRARARIRAGLPDGPLTGVPFLLKDMIAWKGAPFTMGCNLLRDNVAPDSHPWVERMEAAGAVIFGQTNAPELGLLPLTEPALYGPTRNPWRFTHSPGGSSGGSAAAVAARMVPMAHANDGGGSIRIPASACGLFGLKPSRGRNPGWYQEPPEGYAAEHVVTRTVRDSALVLDITRGARPADRFRAPPPVRPYVEEVAREPRRLRVAVRWASNAGQEAHPACRRAVQRAASVCEELGHEVIEAAPDIDQDAFDEAFEVVWATGAGVVYETARRLVGPARVLGPLLRSPRLMQRLLDLSTLRTGKPALEPFTARLARIEATMGPAAGFLAWQSLNRIAEGVATFFEDVDVLIDPVLGAPPWPIGYLDPNGPVDVVRAALRQYVAYTPLANTTGLPAMSVPMGSSAAGLPIGVHVTAGFGDESTLFALAGQLERARGWGSLRPEWIANGS